MQLVAFDNPGSIGRDDLNSNEFDMAQYAVSADPMGSTHNQRWAIYQCRGLTRSTVRKRTLQEAAGPLRGSVPIPLAMMESITSSVPPPIETSLPSRNSRDTGLSHI